MEFKVERKKFVKALSNCQSIIAKKTAIPVLSHFKITTKSNRLTLTGTDLDIVISEDMAADVIKEGTLCLPSITTYDISRRLDNYKELSFSVEGDQLYLRAGKSEFRLPTISSDKFPDVSQLPLDFQFQVKPEKFKKLLDDAKLCIPEEDSQIVLNSVYIHTDENNTLNCAATDMHRLASTSIEKPSDVPEKSLLSDGLIIGRKTVFEIRRLIDDKSVKSVTFGASASRVQWDIVTEEMKIVLSARLVEGVFPKYQKPFLEPHPISIVFKKSILEKALERISVVVEEKSCEVMCAFENNKVTLTANNQNTGAGKEEIEIEYQHEPINIRYNVYYLLGIVTQIDAEEINISLIDSFESTLIRPEGMDTPKYIVMPIVT